MVSTADLQHHVGEIGGREEAWRPDRERNAHDGKQIGGSRRAGDCIHNRRARDELRVGGVAHCRMSELARSQSA